MATVEIEYVETTQSPVMGECYAVASLTTHDDGTTSRMLRVMPVWSVAARMAEYNVAHDEAVVMLLVEPYLRDEPGTVPPVLGDPIWRRGAQAHRDRVAQAHAELGCTALAERAAEPGDEVGHPASVFYDRVWSAETVSAARLVVADQRQALRERFAEPADLPAWVEQPTA